MKKRVGVLFLLGILLISPLIFAQEQTQIYSDFNRFVDNVRMFFSFGDNKVQLALEIREQELNSALENIKENKEEEANKNLENALDKLVVVQEKVSSNVAGEVTDSVNKIVEKINESNLTETLDRYVLEEKKTQLVAELVVEVEGKEGQTLTREVVRGGEDNRRMVMVAIQNENGEIEEIEVEGGIRNDTATWEIVGEINGVNNKIENWVVEHTYAEGTTASGGESEVIIEGSKKGVQIYVAEGGDGQDDVVSESNQVNSDLYNPNARAPGDTVVDPDGEPTNEVVEGDGGEGDYAEGTTADGTNIITE
jgi:hypothetical protein